MPGPFTQTLSEVSLSSLSSRRLESFSALQLLLSDFLGTNEDRTNPFLPHAHPIRSDKFSQWSQFKESRVMEFESSEWRDKTSDVRALASLLHASHVVRRLINMIGHCAPGQYWQWVSTELVSTIINWKLFSNLHFLSDAPRINQNSNEKEKFQYLSHSIKFKSSMLIN